MLTKMFNVVKCLPINRETSLLLSAKEQYLVHYGDLSAIFYSIHDSHGLSRLYFTIKFEIYGEVGKFKTGIASLITVLCVLTQGHISTHNWGCSPGSLPGLFTTLLHWLRPKLNMLGSLSKQRHN